MTARKCAGTVADGGMEREGLDCGNLRENAQARWWTGDGKGKRDNKGTQAGDYGTWQIKKKPL